MKKYKIKSDRFLFINGSNEDLKYYYKNVRLCVYPSRYEGFGIPLIESREWDAQLLRARRSIKEIGGEGLYYFDPDNTNDIKFNLEKVIYDNSKLNDLIDYGYRRCEKYSGKNVLKRLIKYMKVYFNMDLII